VGFLKFSLGKRAPKSENPASLYSSIFTSSKVGSISNVGLSQITENTRSPLKGRSRAFTHISEPQCRRPADLLKQMVKESLMSDEPMPPSIRQFEKVRLPEIIAYN
jgi:hypothetical protein